MTIYLQSSDAATLKNTALSTTPDKRLLPDTMNSPYLSGLLTLNYKELLLESISENRNKQAGTIKGFGEQLVAIKSAQEGR